MSSSLDNLNPDTKFILEAIEEVKKEIRENREEIIKNRKEIEVFKNFE